MTKYDKLLIILVLVASIVSIMIIGKSTANFDKTYAEIYIDGELYKKYSLDKNSMEVVTIETEQGKNIIEIEGYNIRMIESSCPNKLCIKQGTIHKHGQLIVCLPNKIVVQIIGRNDNSDLDTISY